MLHGVVLANVCHLLSVLVLYQLALAVVPASNRRNKIYALIAACVHIFAPAGICLVAPYTEAPFSFLNFLGHLLYVYSWCRTEACQHGIVQDLALVGAGLCFGIAATVRGNGLLSGILFFVDLVLWLGVRFEEVFNVRVVNLGTLPLSTQAHMKGIGGRRIPATIFAGLILAIGFATPQYLAWAEYCASNVLVDRPWCHKIPPSIYSWVQSHYW